MRLYLIRHGETEWNRQKRLQGSMDIPLNENGLAIARQTAEGMGKAGIRFDRIYSSPLRRAYRTAQILCPGQEIQVDDRLREISFGDLEGTSCLTVTDLPMPAPGGESSQDLQSRTMEFLREVTTDPENQGKRILISTHGGVIRSVLMYIKGIPHEAFWLGSVSKNCGVTVLEAEGDTLSIQQENVIFY